MFTRGFHGKKKNMLGCMFGGIIFSAGVCAELKPINDSEMSEITGQAFFSIDKTINPSNSNISYTKLSLGMDIDIQTNIDTLELGRYDRIDPRTGELESKSADLMIDDLSLGYIYKEQYHIDNPKVARPKHYDDSGLLITYQDGDLVPFKIKDPFLEFAYEGDKVVGARIGFGGAQGLLSGTIESLTGNIDVDIKGDVGNLRDALSQQGYGGFCWPWECTMADHIVNLGGIANGIPLETKANMIYGSGANKGSYDKARSTNIGVLDGHKFSLDILGGIDLTVNDCSLLGINVCFPLNQFNSLHISKKDDAGNVTGMADGLFLSFQTKDLAWMKDSNGSNVSSNYMNTVQGAFFNVPTGGLQVDFVGSLNGIPRARTEYIDRGKGLF